MNAIAYQIENGGSKEEEFYRMIGRIEGSGLHRNTSKMLDTMVLKQLHESKAYKNIGMTWDDVCRMIGRSKSSVHEELQNLEAFGQELTKNIAGLGLSRNDMRLLRGGMSAGDVTVDGEMIMIGDTAVSASDKEGIADAIEAIKSAKDAAEKQLEKEKKERDKIVREEVKGYEVERDALLSQNKSLKAELGEREPITEKKVSELASIVGNFSGKVRNLTINERSKSELNREDQGRIFGLLKTMLGEILDLNDLFQSEYEED